jgi:hypothetical protein
MRGRPVGQGTANALAGICQSPRQVVGLNPATPDRSGMKKPAQLAPKRVAESAPVRFS